MSTRDYARRSPSGVDGAPLAPAATESVFVYGLLLPEATRPAQLNDFRLEFARYATIVPMLGCMVLGGVAEVTPGRLRLMDRQEGIAEGYYRRERRELADGNEAWVYIQNQPRSERPDDWYVYRMANEYRRLGHDTGPITDALNRVGGVAVRA